MRHGCRLGRARRNFFPAAGPFAFDRERIHDRQPEHFWPGQRPGRHRRPAPWPVMAEVARHGLPLLGRVGARWCRRFAQSEASLQAARIQRPASVRGPCSQRGRGSTTTTLWRPTSAPATYLRAHGARSESHGGAEAGTWPSLRASAHSTAVRPFFFAGHHSTGSSRFSIA